MSENVSYRYHHCDGTPVKCPNCGDSKECAECMGDGCTQCDHTGLCVDCERDSQ